MPTIGGGHRLAVTATGGKQALGVSSLGGHLEHPELRTPVNERQYAAMPRDRGPLRIVQARVAQRTALNVEVIQAHFAVDATAEYDGASIPQPGPASLFRCFVGQLLRSTAVGGHPPQITHLWIAHEHQPLAVGRITRRVVEVIGIDAVVQVAPLATGQVEHADAAMRVAPDHAAEHQPTAVRGPVEAEQFGAVTTCGLAQGPTRGTGDQHLAATIGTEPRKRDLAPIRRPARETITGTGRGHQQLAGGRIARRLHLDCSAAVAVLIGAFVGNLGTIRRKRWIRLEPTGRGDQPVRPLRAADHTDTVLDSLVHR